MKTLKVSFLIIMGIAFFASQSTVQAGENLDTWPIESGIRGDRSFGVLTIYYEVVDPTSAECIINSVTGETEPLVKMYFFLRLYDRKTKYWHVITAIDEGPVIRGRLQGFCLTLDIRSVDQPQQNALLNFLNGPVLDALNEDCPTCGYTLIHLTDVENDFENLTAPYDPAVPYAVIADIELTAN